ncbi:MAG: hypothetical protein K2P99_02645 [Burkholderiales bacterium]|nr:hypothetical protein [Burkholderiales bacterium]
MPRLFMFTRIVLVLFIVASVSAIVIIKKLYPQTILTTKTNIAMQHIKNKHTLNDKVTSKDIYQYIDSKGNLVISNKLTNNAKKMALPPLAVYANPMSKNDLYTGGLTAIYNPNTIIIKNATPNRSIDKEFIPNINDYGRKLVLSEELDHEKNALSSATELLRQAKKSKLIAETDSDYIERLQTLSDNVHEHQKNVELLTKILY